MSDATSPSSRAPAGRVRKVLIVDDDKGVRTAVANRIGKEPGYAVIEAADHEEALATVKDTEDLLVVFVDQRIGGNERGGLSILKSVLEQRPWLPIVLYAAAPVEDIRREAFNEGALWYLPKVQASNAEDLGAILRVACRLVDVMLIDAGSAVGGPNADRKSSQDQSEDAYRASFERESRAFEEMEAELSATRMGLFVAIYDGRVVDQDTDELTLATRLQRTHPREFVLIRQVGYAEPGDTLFFSPEVEQ